nr:hypothetical protein [uncultured Duganella sp.]
MRELQGQARDNAALKRRVLELEVELFWMKTAPAAPLASTAALLAQLSECAGGMVNGNRLASRAKEVVAVDGTALGLRLVVDPSLPPGIAEIRGEGGKVVARIENIGSAPSAPAHAQFGDVAPRPRTPAKAACWCETCRPITLDDSRMVLCPTCGNKRCPRATNHRNACSGSNEAGQPGSAYPVQPAPTGGA